MSTFTTSGYGQFYYGPNGFLYKKSYGAGARRTTLFNAGGNAVCNKPQYIYNKYKPGGSGIGASNISNRRARNRLATTCESGCGSFYNYLGRYNNNAGNNAYLNVLSEIEEDISGGDEPPSYIPVPIIFNKIFTNSLYPLYPGTSSSFTNGTFIKITSLNTSLEPWSFNTSTGLVTSYINLVQANSAPWFYNTSLNQTPNNSNIIAFQGNSSISQTLNGTIVNGYPYVISFYSALRTNGKSTANSTQLFLNISINGVNVAINFNPQVYSWTFFSLPFIWNNANVVNPILTISQTNTTANDYTIFFSEPSLVG
jgi:hypothetical protein